jgi:hypothetical protein
MKFALFILLVSLFSSSMIPPPLNREITLPGQSELNQLERINSDNSFSINVEQINHNTDLLDFEKDNVSNAVAFKTWSKCSPSVKIPWTGIKVNACGEIEVGYIYIKFCGGVSGLKKCKTFAVWDSKSDCQTLYDINLYVTKAWVEVCPYNISITKQKISTNVQFKVCGKIKWIGNQCSTFYSQSINYKF